MELQQREKAKFGEVSVYDGSQEVNEIVGFLEPVKGGALDEPHVVDAPERHLVVVNEKSSGVRADSVGSKLVKVID